MSKLEFVTCCNSSLFSGLRSAGLIPRNYDDDNGLCRRSGALRLIGMAVIAILPLVVGSCSGGSQFPPRGTPPSNLSYPKSAINATVGTAIAAETPTVMGTVTSYICSPGLPAGLVMDTSAGTIFGTPMAVSAMATYNIKASNSFGSTTTNIQITVSTAFPPPSQLSYPQSSMLLEVGQPFAPNIPSSLRSVASFSVSPRLPRD